MAQHPVAIITGAGGGVGRAATRLLAEAGYDVALVGRTKSKLKDTVAAIEGQTVCGGRPGGVSEESLVGKVCLGAVEVFALDLADAVAVQQLVERVLDRFGRIDALANIAGMAQKLPIEQVTADNWRRCIDANLSYVVQLTAAVWPTFQVQGSGVIVNVSSMASVDPFEGFSIYAAAKAGLNLFTRCSAIEGKAIGVRTVCIAPGAIETPMLRALFDEASIPTQKTLDPGQVAATICDCIRGTRAFEPGETILMPSP